jgi:cobalt-zinc-cadmium efflux system outer membrane protein
MRAAAGRSRQLAESTLDLAQQNLKSIRDTVKISEDRFRPGDISEHDYLKIKLQLLQFQLAYRQALASYLTALEQLREAVGTRNLP